MSHKVRIEPSGREFVVEGDSTLLDAGLSSGVPLRYGCANGSCGECQARLREGEVESVRFCDFPLGEAEKIAGSILLCASAPRTDVVIEADEVGGVAELPQQRVRARPVGIEAHDGGFVVLRLKLGRGAVLRFFAGQKVRLRFPDNFAVTTWIASCPCDGQHLEIHFDQLEDPALCAWLRESARRTDHVEINGPLGTFTLDEGAARPVVFVAQDASFAPIQSLIEHAINLEYRPAMRLYWLATRQGGHYAHNYCRAWADALDDFAYVPLTCSDGASAALTALLARILADCPALDGWDAYIAGTPALLDGARTALVAAGLPPGRCFCDHREER